MQTNNTTTVMAAEYLSISCIVTVSRVLKRKTISVCSPHPNSCLFHTIVAFVDETYGGLLSKYI